MTEMRQDRLAFDFASTRTIDQDGHLKISSMNISRAAVNGYLGREIPGWQEIGLAADKIYKLYRHPDELAKSVDTFNGKPLLDVHKPQSANDHDHQITVGSVHSITFDGKFLKAAGVVWDGDAIKGINDNSRRQLSSSYRYRPDMTPGVTPDGEAFDGIMRDIVGNHVALVELGRAGPECIVGDSANPEATSPPAQEPGMATRKNAPANDADAMKDIRAKLAADSALLAAFDKLAADAAKAKDEKDDDDDEKTVRLSPNVKIGTVEDEKPDDQKDDETDEEYAARKKREAKKDDEDEDDKDDKANDAALRRRARRPAPAAASDGKPVVTQAAMDAAIQAATRSTATATMARFNALREAEREVRPIVGDLNVAMDSAEAVYKFALDHAKVDVTGVPTAAYRALVKMHNTHAEQAAQSPRKTAPMASDSAAVTARAERFPNAARLSH